jgi:aminoglycoside phosphotransferase (APT) family kinase protein
MDPPPDRLLACLRARLGAGVDFATPPAPLSGGFDTTILAFCLQGAPGDWAGPLVVRVMTRGDSGPRVLREAAVHGALVKAGFPAPRILMAEADVGPLGGPFLVMQRLPGETMWSAAARSRSPAAFMAMPRRLAELHAALHRLSGEALREQARAHDVDLTTMSVEADVQRLGRRIEREGLSGLRVGARWLLHNRPAPAQAEVICHGDFHPLNIMVDGERVTGVIDWANASLAEPAYDVAGLRVIALFADPGIPAGMRPVANLARRVMVRRYMRLYRAAQPIDTRNLGYYEAIRLLSALAFAGEARLQAGNPWNAPHTVSVLRRQFERISGVAVSLGMAG